MPRDRRFVAVHRGGPLNRKKHRFLANWAADCAEHLLWMFTERSSDDRPRIAIDVARAWARGEVPVGAAQKAAIGAHAAARKVQDRAARASARAAGHAVATAHMAEHCLGVVIYGARAIQAKGKSVDTEREWQLRRLPNNMRKLIESALERRLQMKGGRELRAKSSRKSKERAG